MRPTTLTLIAAAALAALALIVGCGDDGDSGTSPSGNAAANGDTSGSAAADGTDSAADGTDTGDSSPAGSSKAQFIEAANELCVQSRKSLQQDIAPFLSGKTGKKSPQVLAEEIISEVIAPDLEAQISEIRALDPSPSEEKQVEAILAAIQESVDRAEEDPLVFVRSERPMLKAEKLAREYGVQACGRL